MNLNIILNGAIRDQEEFILIIEFILHHSNKSPNSIRIIVSTWHDDLLAYREIIDYFHSRGVIFLGTASLATGGPANIYRQWRTFDAALTFLEDDDIVLKSRTDKVLLRKDILLSFIFAEDSQILAIRQSNKVGVEHISITLPFMAKDMYFLGSVNNLRALTSYSVRTSFIADHIFNGIGPEVFLWLEYARNLNSVLKTIQSFDLRFISNKVIEAESNGKSILDILSSDEVSLFINWFSLFDYHLCFISDVLNSSISPSWLIDEGIWRYKTGDRPDYELLKKKFNYSLVNTNSSQNYTGLSLCSLNSTSLYQSHESKISKLPLSDPLVDIYDDIIQNLDPEYSNMVLIRNKIIDQYLNSNKAYSIQDIKNALHWNIRQRDNQTLYNVFDWLTSNSPNIVLVSREDSIFVVERIFDMFKFKGDQDSIGKYIPKLIRLINGNSLLLITAAEYYFSENQKLRALYFFVRAYLIDNSSLGVNHGLGCTLLDLGFNYPALVFLRRTHSIYPHDNVACFTLYRCLLKLKKLSEAHQLKNQIPSSFFQ